MSGAAIVLAMRPARAQSVLDEEPFDRWLSPAGIATAEFRRLADGYLVRFPGQADFHLDLTGMVATCTPAADNLLVAAQSLFHNAIEPLMGNFLGGLHLHGSAVAISSDRAIAFLGESRRGKTTLAGGFARTGFPFLTEDTVTLHATGPGYLVDATRPVLRLFPDSARHLLGQEPDDADGEGKSAIEAGQLLPFASGATPLRAIYLLGPGESAEVTLFKLSPQAAMAELLKHSFILDVEDRVRLRGHFRRIGSLVEQVACYRLDYPRIYAQLSTVVDTIRKHAAQDGDTNAI